MAWRTKEEERRQREEDQKRDDDDDSTFDPFEACGHRYPDQVLPEQLNDCYLAWCVADRDVVKYHWVLANLDLLELFEAFAMKRTDLYVDSEDTDK